MATITNTTGVPMPDQPLTWADWVANFNAPQAAVPPPSPYAGMPGVAELFSPTFGRDESIMRGAENAIAGGWGQGGFGQNQTNRLLDSERRTNFLAGHQILEPYLQRDFQGAQNEANRQNSLNQIAAEGAQALQRLQLSEAGQGARLSSELAARLQQQAIEGQQAMQQLTLREAGDTGRQNSQIQGQLANTIISGAMNDRGGTTARPVAAAYDPNNPATRFNWVTQTNEINPGYRPPITGGGGSLASLGLGSSSIDSILRKYGLI